MMPKDVPRWEARLKVLLSMPEPQLVRLEVRFGFDRDPILASKNALDSRLREGTAIEGASQRRYLRTAGFFDHFGADRGQNYGYS